MYTPYEVRRGTSPSRKGKLTISKSKSSRLSYILVETVPLDKHRFKSKKGASVSEEFALFNWSKPRSGLTRLCDYSESDKTRDCETGLLNNEEHKDLLIIILSIKSTKYF